MQTISTFLKQNQEEDYSQFSKKLISSKYKILGIRMPRLRKFAKEITPEKINLKSPNLTHEEILLYGFCVASNFKTEKEQLTYLSQLLPYIDNWATCDCIVCSMKRLKGEDSYYFFSKLALDPREFYSRIGIIGLMRFFLKSKTQEVVNLINSITTEHYYVKMAIAWMIAELAIINFDLAQATIEKQTDKFIRNKAISKARESFRIIKAQKEKLLQLKL